MARGPGRVSNLIATEWLTDLMTRTTHLSLTVGDPFNVVDPKTVEPSGPVYARATVAWELTGRLLRNTNILVWQGLQQNSVITDMSGWDAAFNGQMTFACPIPALDFTEVQTGGLVIPAGEFYVGLDL